MIPLSFPLFALLAFAPPASVSYADLEGDWDMKWNGAPFTQVLDRGGASDCLYREKAPGYGWFGSWTQAKAGELTISETLHGLPDFDRRGQEISFTLTTLAALRGKDGRASQLWLEGSYCGSPLTVHLKRK